ncbi:putative sterigmatocystin biosynthesis monooxygenase stcW [Cercospora beticola]|uniref:Putative sterigmatocystin biosynthesis monooxygenase stcW n=1 Tax=Cercospora beticola TaxID=122368 RepID=A0A2G5I5I9_CERBT|nr:putative sterigmatocystin biosynthesis monooxygenase stcW [Cercospora beticola]PIB00077.1 putative sterigmatocystin biosynthesis monooxygenase stcW [Cercospora beticola]WPB00101.1 hypothetical protein RHO25_004720 [Cercospora beticola]
MASSSIPVVEQPIFTRRKLRVVAIGAGFANIMLAHKHKYVGDNSYIDLVVYEKNREVGGTWLENTYPGVACDVPAHIYCFPFAPNPDWSSFYVGGPEILKYIIKTVDDYKLREYIQVNTKLIAANWSDDKGKWLLKLEQNGSTITDEADVLINGAGFLNRWEWPNIPNREAFRGEMVHSAHWETVDWKDKKVALIGNGSSGIQILPQIQQTAKHVTTYIRTPTWIIPNMLADATPEGKNFQYSEEEKQRFRENPEELKALRQKLENMFNQYFFVFMKGSPTQEAVRGAFRDIMKQRLGGDGELTDKLIPQWPVGCRRITPGDGYLEALTSANVKSNFNPIVKFTEKGILSQPAADTEPEEEEFDLIICATGFNVAFRPAWEMTGVNGMSLQELWKDESEGYMGIIAPQMPNYFSYTGPNSPLGHGSILACYDWCADWVMKWCDKIA